MNKSLFFLGATFLIGIIANAQKSDPPNQTATFEDGTKISYSVLDNFGDGQNRNTIAGFNLTDDRGFGCFSLMYARYNPDRFYVHGELGYLLGAGFGGVNFGGTYFLGSSESNYTLPISIKSRTSGNIETKYVIKIDAIKNRHFGIDIDAAYKKYAVVNDRIEIGERRYEITSFSSSELALGFGYISSKQALIKVENKSYVGGSHLLHLTADVLFYPGSKFEYTASDSISSTVPLEAKDFTFGKIGFRFMIQGQTAFKFNKKTLPTKNFGFFYRLGVMKSTYASSSGYSFGPLSPVIALGFFLSIL